jgi:hypothetical protein
MSDDEEYEENECISNAINKTKSKFPRLWWKRFIKNTARHKNGTIYDDEALTNLDR